MLFPLTNMRLVFVERPDLDLRKESGMALCVHQSPQHNTDAGVFQYHRIAIEFGFGLGREWIGKAALESSE
jgi:hypothetical protein